MTQNRSVSRGYRFEGTREVVEVVPRRQFVNDVWDYNNGQDVTFIGPTQRGKSTLCFQLLRVSVSPERKCVILAGKPPKRDPVMAGAAEKLNLRIIEEWPPGFNPRDKHRNGWVLRPRHTMTDMNTDNETLRREFRKAILWSYRETSHPTIIVMDERYHVENDLKIPKEELDASLLRGSPHSGQWNLLQRGRFVSYNVYSAPEHIFVAYDPDVNNRRRYSEIGGVDPDLIDEITAGLKTTRVPSGGTISQFLYIRRSGPEIYVVDT
jgi:hypothetical protein